jgi:acetyl esterase/lipase
MESIAKYRIRYFGGGSSQKYKFRAIIDLKDDKDNQIGAACFYRDAASLPEKDSKFQGYPTMNFLWNDYMPILDMLRNEKPVFVTYFGGAFDLGSLRTEDESVGEGEPV